MYETTPAQTLAAAADLLAYDVTEDLARIDVPVLVVGGSRDLLTSVHLSRHMADVIPDAELVIFERCGHMAPFERHEELTAHIRKFAERVLRPATLITDVAGVRVGHYTDTVGVTGCTVILLPDETVGAYVLVGAAPGTRETDLLSPHTIETEVHAFVLTGGSAFGLACASGVESWLEEQGIGFEFGNARVPLVPAAVIFDLSIGDPKARPTAEHGRIAAESAGTHVDEGSVGAGTGATVAKRAGPEHRIKGGLGTASARDDDTGLRRRRDRRLQRRR